MTVRIKLQDGPSYLVDEPIEEVQKAYEEALSKKKAMTIGSEDGGPRHLLNPASVSFAEVMDE